MKQQMALSTPMSNLSLIKTHMGCPNLIAVSNGMTSQ